MHASKSLSDHLDLMNSMERHGIPRHLRYGLCWYALNHRPTGDFLRAVLANDFTQAVLRADDESFAALRELARFIHCEMPEESHGSEEKVRKWLEGNGDRIYRCGNCGCSRPGPRFGVVVCACGGTMERVA